jgi:glutamyl-tRNA reductase
MQIGPTIQQFREVMEAIRRDEVERNINRFKPEDRELVELLTKRIVNKILHHPTTVLKQQQGEDETESISRVKALRELFGISHQGKEKHDS